MPEGKGMREEFLGEERCPGKIHEEASREKPNGDPFPPVGGGWGRLLLFWVELHLAACRSTCWVAVPPDILQRADFEQYGTLYCTTRMAHWAEGFVTHHSLWQEKRYNFIYTCGPKPQWWPWPSLPAKGSCRHPGPDGVRLWRLPLLRGKRPREPQHLHGRGRL